VTVTIIDAAGNQTTLVSTVNKKTGAPAAPVVSVPPYVNLANRSSFAISAAGEAFATASWTATGGAIVKSGSFTLDATGAGTGSADLSTLPDGPVTITVTLTDRAGNKGPAGSASTVKDTLPPPAPTVALDARDDSGSSASDYLTNVRAPRFVVTGTAGSMLTVYVNGVVYTGQPLADGTYTVTATATDAAGNVSAAATAPKTLTIDTTPVTGTVTISGAKTIGGVATVRSAALALQLAASGGAAAPVQTAISVDGGTTFGTTTAYAPTASASLPAADGLYTVVVRIVDAAGNIAFLSQTVRLDTTGPAVSASVAGGTNGSFDLGQTATYTASATDVSGVASTAANLDGATTITSGSTINLYTLTAGGHTITITATDGMGNVSTTTVTFQIHATIAGLTNAVNYGNANGLVSSSIQKTLLSTLQSAQAALNGGNTASAKSYLNTFISQVKGAGKAITSSYATLLLSWAQDLLVRM
jgi:hypothetical protein